MRTWASLYLQCWQRRRRIRHLNHSPWETYALRQMHKTYNNYVYWSSLLMGVVVLQGNKRRAVEESSLHPADGQLEGRSLPLKARYGINAWKRWALSPIRPDQSDDTKVKDRSKPGESHYAWLIITTIICELSLWKIFRMCWLTAVFFFSINCSLVQR